NVTVECNGAMDPSVLGEATTTDNCTDPVTNINHADVRIDGSCPSAYSLEGTGTAVDDCGNASDCVQTITVEDTTPPVIICPASVIVECDEAVDPSVLGEATATDNCTDPVTDITYSDTTIPGSCLDTYTIERTWTAGRSSGHASDCVQTITVEDTTPPVIACPASVTIECDDVMDPSVLGEATATDNCTDPVTDITYSDTTIPGSCPDNYTIERTWTAVDNCGNASDCVQTITVEDTTPPVITCPAIVTVECDDAMDPSVLGEATATDN